jgi:hypothetical protein
MVKLGMSVMESLFCKQALRSMSAPNNACCGQVGTRHVILAFFGALSFLRFEGESTLPPQVGNAHRWAFQKHHLSILKWHL